MTQGRRQREKVTEKSTGQGQKDSGTGRTRRTRQTISQRETRRRKNEVMAAEVILERNKLKYIVRLKQKSTSDDR